MPNDDKKPPRKELKDIPAECDSLHKDLPELNLDLIATRFIGILRVTANRALEMFKGFDDRLSSLEAFRDEAMRAYLEAKAAEEAAKKDTPPVDLPPDAPKVKPKKNGHAKKPGLRAVPPTEPAEKTADAKTEESKQS